MSEKSSERTYFRTSTASQRKKLFEVWEESGSVKKACAAARLSRGTCALGIDSQCPFVARQEPCPPSLIRL